MISSLNYFPDQLVHQVRAFGWRCYHLTCAIVGTAFRFIAFLTDKQIEVPLFRNLKEVKTAVVAMLMQHIPDLHIAAGMLVLGDANKDGIFAYIVATKGIWGSEKEVGIFSWYIMTSIHTIIIVIRQR
jgi:hypothetical protein